jgi:hypothetical protein
MKRNRPPSELSLALVALDWPKAVQLLRSRHAMKLAARWSTLQGFFEGLKDAHVLPLHQACAVAGVDLNVIYALVEVYPSAVQMAESSYQRLPLHCACRTAADPLVVKALLEAERTQLKQRTSWSCLQPDLLQRLPLHYALSNGAHPETIRLLLQANPQAAAGVDRRGWTPLHVATSMGCSVDVLQQVYTAYPAAIALRTLQGSSPARCLHRTVRHRPQLKEFLRQARREYTESCTNNIHSLSQVKLQRTTSCSEVDDEAEDSDLLLGSSSFGGTTIARPSRIAIRSSTIDGTVRVAGPQVLRGDGNLPSDGFSMEGTLV